MIMYVMLFQIVEECNGYLAGYCDRDTGDCVCYGQFSSSNGTNNPGNLLQSVLLSAFIYSPK